jgi:glucosamine--fructose-6-phosphate aminotransferase (isomerizing)
MCGIAGLLSGKNKNVIPNIMSALHRLQNRGYDSIGLCVLDRMDNGIQSVGRLHIAKHASTATSQAFEQLEQSICGMPATNIGMGHTRWATHGAKTDTNSHPHISNDGTFAIVHNGIIQNHGVLRSELAADGITCVSDTDSEVVVQLFAVNYRKRAEMEDVEIGKRVTAAIEDTLAQLEGTWALVIASVYTPDSLYCTCNGSPLVIGTSEDTTLACVTSEPAGFPTEVTRCFALHVGDVAVFTFRDEDGNKDTVVVHTRETYIPHVFVRDSIHTLDDFPHWTLKEIMEQPHTINAVLNARLKEDGTTTDEVRLGGLETRRRDLESIDHLLVLGCGTSLHAGEMGARYLRQLCDFVTVQTVDAAEFSVDLIPRSSPKVGAVLLSQSGETADLQRCLSVLRVHRVFTIGVINVRDSLVARAVDCGIYLNAGREVGVASTKSFVSQCAAMAMLAMWFGQVHRPEKQGITTRLKVAADLRQLSAHIHAVLDGLPPKIQQLAPLFDRHFNCFVLGRGKGEVAAREGALKIKEMAYLHCEAYSSAALKHGPFALLNEGFPVVVLGLDGGSPEGAAKTNIVLHELVARGASVVVISDEMDGGSIYEGAAAVLRLPRNDTFGAVLATVHLQMLAYVLATRREINPDRPKNLAKVVTVD